MFGNTQLQKKINIQKKYRSAKRIYCETFKSKYSNYFYESDIKKIKSFDLDFILRFGFGIIRGEILSIPQYGVWSFHHGDEKKYRGGPYGFWEIYYGEPIIGSVLQILTEKLDGGFIIKKGYFKTVKHSFAKNINQVLELTALWPAQVCKEILNNSFVFPEVSRTKAKIFKTPTIIQTIKFIYIIFREKLKYLYNLFIFDEWNIGIINKSIQDVLKSGIKASEINWLAKEDNILYADPFFFEYKKKFFLAFEEMNYFDYKGKIQVIKYPFLNLENIKNFEIIENYHLSYPNFFSIGQKLFCLPESHKSNSLFLYEFINNTWTKYVLLENIRVIDPEIIFYNNLYWLFFNIKGQYHETTLHIYYSENIYSDWRPHFLNPVLFDVRNSRNAGKILMDNGKLIRFGQDYSQLKEGSITISEITTLTTDKYEEKIIGKIMPISDSNYSYKIHTINSINHYTVIDGAKKKKYFYHPIFLIRLILKRLDEK